MTWEVIACFLQCNDTSVGVRSVKKSRKDIKTTYFTQNTGGVREWVMFSLDSKWLPDILNRLCTLVMFTQRFT